MPLMAVARRCRTIESVVLAAVAATVALAGAPARAQEPTGGSSPTGGTAPAPSGGDKSEPDRAAALAPPPTANLYGRPAPRVKRISCRAACASAGSARPGSKLRIAGRNLKPLDEVVFLGAAGDADDTSVAPLRVGRRSVAARVPRTAVSGPVAVARADGTRSPASRRTLAIADVAGPVPAGTVEAEAQGHKVFFGSRRPAEVAYEVGGSSTADVRIELVRAADGTIVRTWERRGVVAGTTQTLRWNGMARGHVQRSGVYGFRVSATSADGEVAQSGGARTGALEAPGAQASQSGAIEPDDPGAFRFLRYRFPLLGAHYFGTGAARFGGGRGHQGQDVFADCGTPIVAARGGVVKFKRYQSAAGNYLVIDGARTGTDFAYMHLREAAIVDEGDRVKTGQPIGFVGATGRADGCHLHFEEWSAPGWYSGGSPFDPLPDLRSWDARS
jgi:murein DD-endopeptidase MepM/ murein hydrolase activator NlpD